MKCRATERWSPPESSERVREALREWRPRDGLKRACRILDRPTSDDVLSSRTLDLDPTALARLSGEPRHRAIQRTDCVTIGPRCRATRSGRCVRRRGVAEDPSWTGMMGSSSARGLGRQTIA